MANKTPPDEINPLAELTQETLDHIADMRKHLDRATKDLDALGELGLDSSMLRQKIDWGHKAIEVILKSFGKPK